jgi:hypothetical protein
MMQIELAKWQATVSIAKVSPNAIPGWVVPVESNNRPD